MTHFWIVVNKEELPNTPIILNCRGEERNDDFTLAYWPVDQHTGEKLLAILDTLLETGEIERHKCLVNLLQEAANNMLYVVSDGNRRVCHLMEKEIGKEWFTELGIFMHVKQEGCFATNLIHGCGISSETESSIDEDWSEKYDSVIKEDPRWPVVRMSELAPCLYYHECIACRKNERTLSLR